MTGDPDGPPTLPGYSSADNSTGLDRGAGSAGADRLGARRAGGRLAARRDAVAVELPRVGVPQRRRRAASLPYGAHSYYVPAQLFSTADGYLALFITHDAFWRSFAAEAGIEGFPTMAERAARRDEVLAVVAAPLATDTATGWEARLRPLGIPAAAVRTLPEALEATPEVVVTAGDFRLVGSPIRVDGYDPEYRPAPRLDEHAESPSTQSS